MIRIYGTGLCPDCVACRESLDAKGVAYEYRDIGTSLQDLSAFMKMRDLNEVFAPLKGTGKIGIPALVKEDGSILLDWEEYLK